MSPQSSDESTQNTPPDPGEHVGEDQSGNGGTDTGRKRRKVTRSRAGCLTCRKRRKLCDMGKPDCGACERLRMVSAARDWLALLTVQECVWPEMRTLGSDFSLRRGSISASANGSHSTHIAPVRQWSASNIPSSNHPLSFRRESFHAASAPPSQIPPQTEQSAVDGLMNLFASDTAGIDDVPYSTLTFPPTGDAPPLASQPPAIPISHPVITPRQSDPIEAFGTENMFSSDMFTFDDVSFIERSVL
jgi:hypothetical protein